MASISEKISTFLGEQRNLVRDFYHLDYWDNHTLSEGFSEAMDGAFEMVENSLRGSSSFVQASAGAGMGLAKLLGGIPIALNEWGIQTIREVPKGPGQTIYKVFEVPVKGFYHGGVFVFETTKQWSDGSLNSKDSYAIANEVTSTLGMAALILFGMKKGVDGGGKFLSGMKNAADLAVFQAQNGMATATVTAGSVALGGGSDLLAGVMMMSAGEGSGGGKKPEGFSTKGSGCGKRNPTARELAKMEEVEINTFLEQESPEVLKGLLEGAVEIKSQSLKLSEGKLLSEGELRAIKNSDEVRLVENIAGWLAQKGEGGFLRSHKDPMVQSVGETWLGEEALAALKRGESPNLDALPRAARDHVEFWRDYQRALHEGLDAGIDRRVGPKEIEPFEVRFERTRQGIDLLQKLEQVLPSRNMAAIDKAVTDLYFYEGGRFHLRDYSRNIDVLARLTDLERLKAIVQKKMGRDLTRKDVEAYDLIDSYKGDINVLAMENPMVQFWLDVIGSKEGAELGLPPFTTSESMRAAFQKLGLTKEAIKAEIERQGGDADKAMRILKELARLKMKDPKKDLN